MDAVVILLDVSSTMCNNSTKDLENAIEAINLLIQQKILYKPKDEVGLVLFGSNETHNELEDDGYENIFVEREISYPDVNLLKLLQDIQPGDKEGDLIDALIVGMDMLVSKIQLNKKLLPRLFLVTNAASPANTDSLEIVLAQLKKMNAQLNVIGINFENKDNIKQEDKMDDKDKIVDVKKLNEQLLHTIVNEVDGVVLSIEQAMEVMSNMRSTTVMQRPVYTGFFEISEELRVSVKCFLKTSGKSFPTMKKASLITNAQNPTERPTALQERTYHSIDDLDSDIVNTETVKGYKYGKSLVPISSIDNIVLQYTCEKTLQLIGFTKASNVPRYHYMGNTEVVAPTDERSSSIISGLVRSMLETNSVAIVRYSNRKNTVKLAVLIPHISLENEYFYLHKLPFAEDLRHFPFPPLDPTRARPSIVPTNEQLEAIDNLIDKLDLSKAGIDEDGDEMELLKPKHTYNPALQHFYRILHLRALNPEIPIPKINEDIESYLLPNKQLFDNSKDEFDTIKDLFPLEVIKSTEKVQKRYWADSNIDELRLESYAHNDESGKKKTSTSDTNLSIDSIIAGGTSDVSSIDPVMDFKKMISRRDVDLVDKAIEQMKERILQLINDSVKDQLYPKALACVEALRNGCVQEEEPAAFNTFLRLMRTMQEGKRHNNFWLLILDKKISLIHEEECEESDITLEESNNFLQSNVKEPEEKEQTISQSDDVDDLFDLIE